MEKIENERIREILNVKHPIVEYIEDNRLVWFGHLQRMPETSDETNSENREV